MSAPSTEELRRASWPMCDGCDGPARNYGSLCELCLEAEQARAEDLEAEAEQAPRVQP